MAIKFIFFLALTAAIATPALAAGPYYARGSFYAGTGAAWGYDAGNEMFDDGLHGDGAAGDGVYGVYVTADQAPGVHEWKIANADWTENYPNNPAYPTQNAVLFMLTAGEMIHFRLDANTLGDGWQPATNAVACSHSLAPDATFELIGSPPELGGWQNGIPATMGETLWITSAVIADPGSHAYKYRVIGTWDVCNIGIHYNMFIGDNFTFETTNPMTTIRFEFNPIDGRARAVPEGIIATEDVSWGQVKGLFR
jgi:hypothetical protein